MFRALLRVRTALSAAFGAALLLAGCTSSNVGTTAAIAPPSPAVTPITGEVLGTGSTRIALLLPLSATGNAGAVAVNVRNAAALALQEYQGADIQILLKDDRGTSDGARAAASEAIGQGAELILGPLFAQSVTGAASVARPAGVPMVAFSTDASTASPGVYLLSFLPRSDVERIIGYAGSQGYRSIAALLPQNAYGAVVEAALQQAVAQSGGRLVAIERYALDRVDMQAKAEAIASIASQGLADAVFMPDAGDAAPFLAQVLAAKNVRSSDVKFLGSGQWNDPRILGEPALAGAWFPGPPEEDFQAFSGRYQAAHGAEPFRSASLGYDATILAAGLTANFGDQRFAASTITNPVGFKGMDGAFRFLPDGTNQRGLAVYEVSGGDMRVIDAAPVDFGGLGF